MAVVPPIVPIAVMAKRRRIVHRFRDAAAHSPETARPLAELHLTRGLIVRRMIKGGVLREAPSDRFWLDEAANAAFRRRALVRVAVVLGVVAVGAVILVLSR